MTEYVTVPQEPTPIMVSAGEGRERCNGNVREIYKAMLSAAPSTTDAEDARRYRWLRVQKHADIAACWFLPTEAPFCAPSTPSEIDAAIDEAMKGER